MQQEKSRDLRLGCGLLPVGSGDALQLHAAWRNFDDDPAGSAASSL
jgi:hypothetical protein